MNMSNITYTTLTRLWLQETSLLLFVAFCFWWFNSVIAYSVLIGGLIYIIPNMYFAFYAFRYCGAQAAQYVLMSFYRGEIGKFLLSSVGFAITFTLVQPLNLISVFSAYIALTIFQCVRLQSLTKD